MIQPVTALQLPPLRCQDVKVAKCPALAEPGGSEDGASGCGATGGSFLWARSLFDIVGHDLVDCGNTG